MLTELLIKQMQRESDFIDDNLPSFLTKFFDEESAVDYLSGDVDTLVAFEYSGIYVQKLTKMANGSQDVDELLIPYEDYNDWCKNLIQ